MSEVKADTTSEWIEVVGNEVQVLTSVGEWRSLWYTDDQKYRIRNPYYIKPEPSVFDRCVVGQTVLHHRHFLDERVVVHKNSVSLTLGGEKGVVNFDDININYEIIRGGKE